MTRTKSNSEVELLLAIQSLTEEVQVLRQVVDELREEVQWVNHNPLDEQTSVRSRRIWSCSLDPTSPDFAVNSVDQETVEDLRQQAVAANRLPQSQGKLFR